MTPERQALLAQLEHENEIRLAKARTSTKAWKLRNPHRVNAPAKERQNTLKILQHEKAIHDKAVREGDLSVYDPSMDQIM